MPVNDAAQRPVLVLGAASDIALAVARRFAQAGHPILLAARQAATRLERDAADLRLRSGAPVTLLDYDVLDEAAQAGFVAGLDPLPEVVVLAIGALGEEAVTQRDPDAAARVIATNYTAPVRVLTLLANRMEERGSGTIIGISSVAGDRGRGSNYVYGSAKAGLTAFLSGLDARLAKRGCRAITVRPGFVATRMTEGMKLPGLLTAKPEAVAARIHRAYVKGWSSVYTPGYWRLIMTVIRSIPGAVFRRLSI